MIKGLQQRFVGIGQAFAKHEKGLTQVWDTLMGALKQIFHEIQDVRSGSEQQFLSRHQNLNNIFGHFQNSIGEMASKIQKIEGFITEPPQPNFPLITQGMVDQRLGEAIREVEEKLQGVIVRTTPLVEIGEIEILRREIGALKLQGENLKREAQGLQKTLENQVQMVRGETQEVVQNYQIPHLQVQDC